jgi:hypothetical protein
MKIYVRWHVPDPAPRKASLRQTPNQALKLPLELTEQHTFPDGTIRHVYTLT